MGEHCDIFLSENFLFYLQGVEGTSQWEAKRYPPLRYTMDSFKKRLVSRNYTRYHVSARSLNFQAKLSLWHSSLSWVLILLFEFWHSISRIWDWLLWSVQYRPTVYPLEQNLKRYHYKTDKFCLNQKFKFKNSTSSFFQFLSIQSAK